MLENDEDSKCNIKCNGECDNEDCRCNEECGNEGCRCNGECGNRESPCNNLRTSLDISKSSSNNTETPCLTTSMSSAKNSQSSPNNTQSSTNNTEKPCINTSKSPTHNTKSSTHNTKSSAHNTPHQLQPPNHLTSNLPYLIKNPKKHKTIPYKIISCSSYSSNFLPSNIQKHDPTDSNSRWSTTTNDHQQYIILELCPGVVKREGSFKGEDENKDMSSVNEVSNDTLQQCYHTSSPHINNPHTSPPPPNLSQPRSSNLSQPRSSNLSQPRSPSLSPRSPLHTLLCTIKFGKYSKLHVCNIKEMRISASIDNKTYKEIFYGGLRNDTIDEVFNLKWYDNGEYVFTKYIKIEPLQAWGINFNYSMWFVEIKGITSDMIRCDDKMEGCNSGTSSNNGTSSKCYDYCNSGTLYENEAPCNNWSSSNCYECCNSGSLYDNGTSYDNINNKKTSNDNSIISNRSIRRYEDNELIKALEVIKRYRVPGSRYIANVINTRIKSSIDGINTVDREIINTVYEDNINTNSRNTTNKNITNMTNTSSTKTLKDDYKKIVSKLNLLTTDEYIRHIYEKEIDLEEDFIFNIPDEKLLTYIERQGYVGQWVRIDQPSNDSIGGGVNSGDGASIDGDALYAGGTSKYKFCKSEEASNGDEESSTEMSSRGESSTDMNPRGESSTDMNPRGESSTEMSFRGESINDGTSKDNSYIRNSHIRSSHIHNTSYSNNNHNNSQNNTWPCERGGHQLVSTNNGLYLYGGWNGKEELNDLWLYTNNKWTQIFTPTSPGLRSCHKMCSDNYNLYLNGRYVTIQDKEFSNEMWVYRDNEWSKLNIQNNRPNVYDHFILYHDKCIYMFGGKTTDSFEVYEGLYRLRCKEEKRIDEKSLDGKEKNEMRCKEEKNELRDDKMRCKENRVDEMSVNEMRWECLRNDEGSNIDGSRNGRRNGAYEGTREGREGRTFDTNRRDGSNIDTTDTSTNNINIGIIDSGRIIDNIGRIEREYIDSSRISTRDYYSGISMERYTESNVDNSNNSYSIIDNSNNSMNNSIIDNSNNNRNTLHLEENSSRETTGNEYSENNFYNGIIREIVDIIDAGSGGRNSSVDSTRGGLDSSGGNLDSRRNVDSSGRNLDSSGVNGLTNNSMNVERTRSENINGDRNTSININNSASADLNTRSSNGSHADSNTHSTNISTNSSHTDSNTHSTNNTNTFHTDSNTHSTNITTPNTTTPPLKGRLGHTLIYINIKNSFHYNSLAIIGGQRHKENFKSITFYSIEYDNVYETVPFPIKTEGRIIQRSVLYEDSIVTLFTYGIESKLDTFGVYSYHLVHREWKEVKIIDNKMFCKKEFSNKRNFNNEEFIHGRNLCNRELNEKNLSNNEFYKKNLSNNEFYKKNFSTGDLNEKNFNNNEFYKKNFNNGELNEKNKDGANIDREKNLKTKLKYKKRDGEKFNRKHDKDKFNKKDNKNTYIEDLKNFIFTDDIDMNRNTYEKDIYNINNTYNSNNINNITSNSPSARTAHQFVLHKNKLYLFGGNIIDKRQNDMWSLTLTKKTPSSIKNLMILILRKHKLLKMIDNNKIEDGLKYLRTKIRELVIDEESLKMFEDVCNEFVFRKWDEDLVEELCQFIGDGNIYIL